MNANIYETRMMRPRAESVKVTILHSGIELVIDGQFHRLHAGAVVDMPKAAAAPLLRRGAADLVVGPTAAPTTLLEADSDA